MDLSGNVWEWTRSLYEKYPYPDNQKDRIQREDLKASQDEPGVLRGGGFFVVQRYARCAYRLWFAPVSGLDLWGFRVVVLPPLTSDPSGL